MSWDPANAPPGWRFEPVARAWQRRNDHGEWELSEPPPEAFGPASTARIKRIQRGKVGAPGAFFA